MRRSKTARPARGNVQTKSFSFEGGLNLVDAPLTVKPGMCLSAVNFEHLRRGGYRRIDGYERFDGQDSPSEASYWILNFDAGDIVQPPIDGHMIGATSGAIGKIGSITLTSGSWAGSDAAGHIVVLVLSGNFVDNETITFLNAGDGFSNGFSNGCG